MNEDLHRGDIVRCGHCGYAYTYTARHGTGCRRCGSSDLRRWRPGSDAAPESPATGAGPL